MRILIAVCSLLFLSLPIAANSSSPQLVREIVTEHGPMDAVAFSPDGRLLATGGRDNLIRLWDVATGTQQRILEVNMDWVTDLVWHPDNRTLISGSRDGTVRITDTQTGRIQQIITAHSDPVTSLALTTDGDILATGGHNSTIHFVHLPTTETLGVVENFGGLVWDLAFRPNSRQLASASEDGSVWFWDILETATPAFNSFVAHDAPVASLAFSSDGSQLLTSGLDNRVHVWAVPYALQDLDQALAPTVTFNEHLAPVLGLAFLNDDETAITASLDGSVRVWDIREADSLASSTAYTDQRPFTGLSVAANGQIAIVGTQGLLSIWDIPMDVSLVSSEAEATSTSEISRPSTETIMRPTLPAQAASTPRPTRPVPTALPPVAGRLLSIPSANIRSSIITFPIENRTWAIDPWEHQVGHFYGTAWLNQTGNLVLGGHSEYPDGTAGIFGNLYNVGIGDEITVQEGTTIRHYVVVQIREVNYRDLSVVHPTNHNRLTLITCDIPSYVAQQGIYYERLVVIADEVPFA